MTIRRLLDTEGRSGRAEYWGITLPSHIVCWVVFILWVGTGFAPSSSSQQVSMTQWAFLIIAPSCGLLWLTVLVRRLRDAGMSLAWVAPCCIPVIGYLVWFYVGIAGPKEQG